MGIGPCTYPRCDDGHGNATLTMSVICEYHQRRLRRLLDWVVLDYVQLKNDLPKPARRENQVRGGGERIYGHPAEWASDLAATIANELNGLHDTVADLRKETPPPHPGTSEPGRVRVAYRYLTDRFDNVADLDTIGDLAAQLEDAHGKARSGLGLTPLVQRLPTPCPDCDVVALTRMPGGGNEQIDCGECGRVIREEHYGLFTEIVLDDLIDAYDAEHESDVTFENA